MRYFVVCREHPHEKVFLGFEGAQPSTREEIPLAAFSVRCPQTNESAVYGREDVMAEAGSALPLAGSAVGALLFLFAPLAGVVGTIAGYLGGASREADQVKRFNESGAA